MEIQLIFVKGRNGYCPLTISYHPPSPVRSYVFETELCSLQWTARKRESEYNPVRMDIRLWPLLLTWFNCNPNMISNHMLGKVWNEITYPFSNFNGTTHRRKSRITRNTNRLLMCSIQVKLQVARCVQLASNDIMLSRNHFSKYHSIKPNHYIQPRHTQLQTIITIYNLTSIYIYAYWAKKP